MLPKGWISKASKSRQGQIYYVNSYTGESQWELPTGMAQRNANSFHPHPFFFLLSEKIKFSVFFFCQIFV